MLVWRKGSRAAGFERWTSILTPSKVASASAERPGRVRESARVHDDGHAGLARGVDRFDQIAFKVGLNVKHAVAR